MPGHIVLNPAVTQQRGLPLATLLGNTRHVQQIRARSLAVRLFISDADRYTQLEELHRAVTAGEFTEQFGKAFKLASYKPYRVFLLELPDELHAWLTAHPFDEIRQQVTEWMGAFYAANRRRDQMWKKLLPDVKGAAGAYPNLSKVRTPEDWTTASTAGRQMYESRGLPGFLVNPFEEPRDFDQWPPESPRFAFRAGYFSPYDWITIAQPSRAKVAKFHSLDVKRNAAEIDQKLRSASTDKLVRAEGDAGLWQAWKAAVSGDTARATELRPVT